MPEGLWGEAIRVARIDGVWQTAKATRIKYETLKRRMWRAEGAAQSMERARAKERGHRAGRPKRRMSRMSSSSKGEARWPSKEFVELSPLVGASHSTSPSTSTGTVIEVEDRAGTRLIVRLAKETRVDVATLISAFRRRSGRGA
jgi:hypothetical protein